MTYLIQGEIEHEDSLRNKGVINDGECQWMTAGSGILHQEMPKEADRMLGLQLWVNLPQKDKMTEPRYFDISKDMVPVVKNENGIVRVISGTYAGEAKGVDPAFVKASLFDITIKPGKTMVLDTNIEDNVFIFLILGDGYVGEKLIAEKTAVLFGEGTSIQISATDEELRFFYFGGKPLKESTAWAGPIVMNTKEELTKTFEELEEGNFIKHK